jgi:argininosuccinate lyase
MQEDKQPTFDAFDTVDACLDILAGSIATARFDVERMRQALRAGFVDATEIADYLAARGVPFRDAHHVSARLVQFAVSKGKVLSDLSLAELRTEHRAFDQDVYAALDAETAVERRQLPGAPARAMVDAEINAWQRRLEQRGADLSLLTQRYAVFKAPAS